jgi:uncharacterized membrane protein (DUF2068 family)
LQIDSNRRAMQLVALTEAFKGFIVLAAGFGLLALIHHDVRHVALSLVTRLHIDPSEHYAGLFLDLADHVTDLRLWGAAGLAVLYSAIRLAEGYGLWFAQRWAAWLGALSGALYVPIEIYELWHKPSGVKAATLALNIAVVAYLGWTLWRGRTDGQPTAVSSSASLSASSPRNPPL